MDISDEELGERVSVGKFFAQLRYKINKTQRELGAETGIGQASITAFERGQNDFKFSTISRIAKRFGYKVQYRLVPLSGEGEILTVEPDPQARSTRTYGGNTMDRTWSREPKSGVRKAPSKPEPQREVVVYETEEEFDLEAELAATRRNLGL